jgi:hypothetical protein
MGSLSAVLEESTKWKIKCTTTQGCMGWNKDIYDGVSDQCGPFKPFTIWNKHVNERKYDAAWELFQD